MGYCTTPIFDDNIATKCSNSDIVGATQNHILRFIYLTITNRRYKTKTAQRSVNRTIVRGDFIIIRNMTPLNTINASI